MKPALSPSAGLLGLLAILTGTTVLSADVIRLDQPVSASVPDALVLYWPFDETSGVEAHNKAPAASGGNDYNGFLFAGGFEAPQFVPGVNAAFGNAVHLQGGEKRDVQNDANPHVQWTGEETLLALDLPAEPFTAGLWLHLDHASEEGQTHRLLGRGRFGVGNFWDLSLKSVRSRGEWKLAFDFTVSAGEEGSKSLRAWVPAHFRESRWHHLAVSYEPLSEQEASVILYIDGVEVSRGNLPVIAGNLTASDRRVTVGERAVPAYQSRLSGKIDDVFIAKGVHHFTPLTH